MFKCPVTVSPILDITIFLGLIGLTLLEYGVSRKGFGEHLLLKNFVQFSVGTLAYWLVGFGFAFGSPNKGFIGEDRFGGQYWIDDQQFRCFSYTGLVGIFVVFIINGAVAERLSYISSICFTALLMIFTWPVIVSWVWGGGWLTNAMDEEITDLGGSIIVYTFAGAYALIGTIFTGPRLGRFNSLQTIPFEMVNHEFYIIGSFLTVLGCFGIGFSQQDSAHYGFALAHLWICGAVSSLLTNRLLCLWNPSLEMNLLSVYQGFIAGMVLISSAAGNTTAWQAGLHGVLASLMFSSGIVFVKWVQIDDPTNVISTFLLPGICGGILPGFVDDNKGVYWAGWKSGQLLGVQTVGTATVFVWACLWAAICFGVFWLGRFLLIRSEVQKMGLARAVLTQSGYSYTYVKPEDR